jgi:hypothetical protein
MIASTAVSRRLSPPMFLRVVAGSIACAVAAGLLAVLAFQSTSTLLHFGAPVILAAVATWMFFSEHYERTLPVLALYLGVIDGFLKLKTGSTVATLGRDVLLYAIAGGAFVRLMLRRRPLHIPILTLGVLAWVVICFAQVLNPVVPSISHAFAGVRQHIEFVPLFFLGYAVMRSERRLMGLFGLLLFAAAANGVVSLVQSHLSPEALASWGPGYAKLVLGTGSLTGGARTFLNAATGLSNVRPPALGSDAGFGGVIAAMALPGALALALGGGSYRRYYPLLGAGVILAVVGIATSQSRTAVVTAAVAVLFFLLLTVTTRRGLVAVVITAMLALTTYFGVTTLFGSVTSSANRYNSIAPTKVISTTVSYRQATLALIPSYIVHYPLGNGIGESGPAGGSGVGGSVSSALDAESEPTFLIIELGVPGLIAMFALAFWAIRMGVGLRIVAERRLQFALAALTAVFMALCASWVVGVNTANSPTSPFIWLTLGTLAYWYREMSRGRLARRSRRVRASLATR